MPRRCRRPAIAFGGSKREGRQVRLLIYGSRSFAITVADLARDCGHEVVGMIDDLDARGDGIVGAFAELGPEFDGFGVVMGIGYNSLAGRWNAWQKVRASGRPTPVRVHPRAYVSSSASVGSGSLVKACAVVDRAARLEVATVLWPAACVNHDTEIGASTFISPNATFGGNVRVGPHTFAGAAATIADHCEVPDHRHRDFGTRKRAFDPTAALQILAMPLGMLRFAPCPRAECIAFVMFRYLCAGVLASTFIRMQKRYVSNRRS